MAEFWAQWWPQIITTAVCVPAAIGLFIYTRKRNAKLKAKGKNK